MLPPERWRERLTEQEYQSYRYGSAYFLPADDPWVREKIGVILPDNTAVKHDPEAWHPNDLLFLPLYDREQNVISLISLDSPSGGKRPTPRTLQLVELYVQVATPVIENALLYQETQRQLSELKTVNEVSQAISTIIELNELMQNIGNSLATAYSVDSYYISLYNQEEDVLTFPLLVDHGSPVVTAQIPADFGPTNYIFRSGQPLLIRNKSDWEVLDSKVYGDLSESYLGVPMRTGDRVIGVLAIQDYQKANAFTQQDINTLTTIASQAAVAVENARLVEETLTRSEELRTLFEDTYQRERFFAALGRVSLAINATFDLPTVLNLICKESLSLFNVDGAYIWQRQEEDLVGIAAAGHAQADFVGSIIGAAEDFVFASAVAASGEGTFSNHFKDEENVHLRLPAQDSIEAVLGIPLKKEDEIIGVLVLVDQSIPERFGPRDIEQATVFGVQAAIAIQNAQLVTELRYLNEELDERVAKRTLAFSQERDRVQYLLRVTTELTASLDEDRVLSRALELVNEVVNATQGGILLINTEQGNLVYRAAFGENVPAIPKHGLDVSMNYDEGLAGWLIRNRKPVVIDDIREDDRWMKRPNSLDPRSVLAVPLISSEEVIGILMLFHKEPKAFTDQQLELVEAAASQVASAINNAQLYLLIRDQAERLGKMLREEQVEAAKMQAMLESIADGVLVTDAGGHVILANRPSSLILDIPRSQLIGKSLNELLGLYSSTGESWIQTIEAWSRSIEFPRENIYLSDRLIIEDLVVSVQLSPVFANNQFFGTVSIFRDITQEVVVDRMKSEFVSTVSHELRTPMTSIKGYADLILMGAAGPMTDPQVRYMHVIKNNADRLSMLVNDLLDISRIETGKTELDLRPLDIPQIIEQVVEGHLRGRIEHEEKPMEVQTEMAPSLPLVNADHARVTQVLTNLIDNAFHYTPANGRIGVKVRANGEFVFISVSDTGIGITRENQRKIFDRFFRAEDSEVQRIAGTGLGLSIVHSLIEMHGGNIEVQSTPGEGSTFTFCLPLVAEDKDIV
jgi:signal transduction histidine kinase